MGDHDQNKRADDKGQVDLPAEFDPGAVINAAHGQLYQGTSGPEAVGDTVAVLISKYQYLLIDAQNFSQGLENGHDNDCLSAAGYHQEIEQCDKYKNDQQRQYSTLVFQHYRHGVNDRIHDAGLVHQYHYGLGQTYGKSSGEYANSAFAEQLTCFTGLKPENNCQDAAHDHIKAGDLGKGPSKTDAAESLYYDHRQKDDDTKRSGYSHFLHSGSVVFPVLTHIFLVVKTAPGILFDLAAVSVKSDQADYVKDSQTYSSKSDP